MRKILAATAPAWLAALFMALPAATATAQGPPVLGPGDTAIAIDLDAVFIATETPNGRYPGAENPPKAIDATLGTKYLNFGGAGSGFIVTPAAATTVESFQIRTGNDAPGRDPSSWELYGFNGALTTTDSGATPAINADGLAEAWTLIGSGGVSLPGDPAINNDQRGVLGPLVDVPTAAAFQHYKMIFPTVKTTGSIMQFDEIQFFSDNAGATGILAPGNPIIAVDEIGVPPHWEGSSFPGNEIPARGIDQSVNAMGVPNTKYLNFGEEKSGLIITNSEGPVQLWKMRLTTANDSPERDPASFELYGTNDPIVSPENSPGTSEAYTLIASGALSLPAARNDASTIVSFDAPAAFASYKLIFPTVKNAAAANSMQIADVQLYAIPEPATTALALVGLVAGACLRRKG
jgi:hypothetical protein